MNRRSFIGALVAVPAAAAAPALAATSHEEQWRKVGVAVDRYLATEPMFIGVEATQRGSNYVACALYRVGGALKANWRVLGGMPDAAQSLADLAGKGSTKAVLFDNMGSSQLISKVYPSLPAMMIGAGHEYLPSASIIETAMKEAQQTSYFPPEEMANSAVFEDARGRARIMKIDRHGTPIPYLRSFQLALIALHSHEIA